jgi:hypothetical protein
MSQIGKNNVKNVQFDWQTEALPSASSTGQLEGFELSRAAATATVRESNVCQISSRDATVTCSQQASDPAGKKSEMAHQLAIMAKALKRDMEKTICGNTAKTLVLLLQQGKLVALKLGLKPMFLEALMVLELVMVLPQLMARKERSQKPFERCATTLFCERRRTRYVGRWRSR